VAGTGFELEHGQTLLGELLGCHRPAAAAPMMMTS
jgi:hypothetical protein